MNGSILLVEDDVQLASLIQERLFDKGYRCTISSTLDNAYSQLEMQLFDLVILDRMLPDGDGITLLETIAEILSNQKVIVLSQRASEFDRVKGLEKGAIDYIPKPFSIIELQMKIRNALSLTKHRQQEEYTLADGSFFPESGVFHTPKNSFHLRPKEAALLTCLLRARPATLSREKIIDALWPFSDEAPTPSTIDVYIRRLRLAIKPYSFLIQTIRGFGYRCKD